MALEKTIDEIERIVTPLADGGSQTTIVTRTTLRAGRVITVQNETVR